jgi:hypothetical protein
VVKPAMRMAVFSFAIETSTLAALLAEHAVRMDIGVMGGESHVTETRKQLRNGHSQPALPALAAPQPKVRFKHFVLHFMSESPDHTVTNQQLKEACEAEGRSITFSSQLTTMKNDKLIKSAGKRYVAINGRRTETSST